MPDLILASASPRRRDLLEQIGITPFKILPADIDESTLPNELGKALAGRLSLEKAQHIAKDHKDCFILAADTVVSCGRRILPKAEDIDTAKKCLSLLSGRRHRVYGGITLIAPDGRISSRIVCSIVSFKKLSEKEMTSYLNSHDWDGKAGGYAIQGRAASFVKSINGSYSNIVGLSLFETSQMLTGLGYEID